jgi:hypothetical protein
MDGCVADRDALGPDWELRPASSGRVAGPGRRWRAARGPDRTPATQEYGLEQFNLRSRRPSPPRRPSLAPRVVAPAYGPSATTTSRARCSRCAPGLADASPAAGASTGAIRTPPGPAQSAPIQRGYRRLRGRPCHETWSTRPHPPRLHRWPARLVRCCRTLAGGSATCGRGIGRTGGRLVTVLAERGPITRTWHTTARGLPAVPCLLVGGIESCFAVAARCTWLGRFRAQLVSPSLASVPTRICRRGRRTAGPSMIRKPGSGGSFYGLLALLAVSLPTQLLEPMHLICLWVLVSGRSL